MHVRLDRPSCPVRRRGPATEWLSEERGGYHRIVCRSQTLYLPPAVQAAAPAPPSVSISLPRIFVLDSAGRRRGCGSHNPIHGGDIDELLEPFPQYSHAGLAIALAALKAAQLRDPAHRLPQRRRHIRRDRDPLDTAVQALPFVVV